MTGISACRIGRLHGPTMGKPPKRGMGYSGRSTLVGVPDDLRHIEQRLDDLTVPFLVPIRIDKEIRPDLLEELLRLGDDLIAAVANQSAVPRSLVGKSWFIFTQMLGEADHAAAPDGILDSAWAWQDKLRKAFGPTF